jgi:adenylate kinase
LNILIFGPPGSGKGTMAKLLAPKLNVVKITYSELLREEVDSGSELGEKIKSFMDAGKLVPDDISIEILKKKFSQKDVSKGFILDGFPRTIDQAKAINEITEIDFLIYLNPTEDVIIERLSNRRVCKDCHEVYNIKYMKPKEEGICDKCGGELYQREDDKPEVIKERIKVYEQKTRPVLDFFREKMPFVEYNIDDANVSPELNAQRIFDQIKEQDLI